MCQENCIENIVGSGLIPGNLEYVEQMGNKEDALLSNVPKGIGS